MRFSHWISTAHPTDEVIDRGRHAEATGWDGLWLADHFMTNKDGPSDSPMHECFALLAALAIAVPRVRLGSLVAGNTYRHPAVLAKTAATIDHLSGGRMVLGLGAGWQVNEHEAYGIPLGSTKERLAWFEEACQVVTGLRDQARTTVAGDRYQLTEAPLEPKPIGPLPLLIGSSGQTVMARIVATYAQEWNTWSTPALWVEKKQGYDRALAAAGRDPSTLHTSTQALVLVGPDGAAQAEDLAKVRPAIGGTAEQLVDTIGQWAEAGLDELVIPDFTLGDTAQAKENLDLLITEVASAFR